MMVNLPEVRSQVTSLWGSINSGTKKRMVVALIGGVVLVAGIILLTRPSYEVLFANLTAGDAGEITTRLEEMNIPFQLADNGSSVLVPENEVYRARNQLVMEGIPRGGIVDFGIFDETRLGSTEFERRVQYRRALQGELTRTITSMAGIQNAWVQISIPEQRLYLAEEEKASAAILLDTVGQLNHAQVRGIVHLVSHSVEGLEPDFVTVVDNRGQVLTRDLSLENNFLGLTTNQLELQRQVETELERGLRTMLEMVIGQGKVVARVNAQINFDQREVTSQFFETDNGEGVLRSMQELERSFHGQSGAGGIPGTDSNIPGGDIPIYQAGGDGESEYYEREVVRNFDISEIREHRVVAPGQVERLSVAVLIDEGDLTMDQRLAIEETVATAVGIDYNRGDQISVTTLPFAEPPFPDLTEPEPVGGLRWYHYLLGIASALAVGMVLLQFLRRRRGEYVSVWEQEAAATSQEEEEHPEDNQKRQVINQVESLARQRPELVAQVLSTWLAED